MIKRKITNVQTLICRFTSAWHLLLLPLSHLQLALQHTSHQTKSTKQIVRRREYVASFGPPPHLRADTYRSCYGRPEIRGHAYVRNRCYLHGGRFELRLLQLPLQVAQLLSEFRILQPKKRQPMKSVRIEKQKTEKRKSERAGGKSTQYGGIDGTCCLCHSEASS